VSTWRPLMTKGIADLEQLLKEASGDQKSLRRLADELACRSTARAASLLAEVRSALNSAKTVQLTVPHAISAGRGEQLSLVPETTVAREEPGAMRATPPSIHQAAAQRPMKPSASATGHEPTPKRSSLAAPEPSMELDAAYQTLKVSRSATWYTIEMARRQIVRKASPTELEKLAESARATVTERARKANEATKRLWLEFHGCPR
jgi:hypothetical protein